ncbi:PrsW family intramembrane metalloprotease [Halobacteriales archaeon SW_5_70_135]|nr:MAG: PrsW family intramembrane metalloprotease [Halobacteriales archaeon SW_5_70_135]
MTGPRFRPRKVLRIARWEVSRTAGTVDRRTLVVTAALVVVAALVGPAAVGGVALDDGIHRVGVSEDSPYRPVVEQHAELAAGPPTRSAYESGRVDVLVVDGEVVRPPRSDRTGRAAYDALRSAVEAFNDDLLGRAVDEGRADAEAAFPVDVRLRYERRTRAVGSVGSDGDGSGDGDTGTDGGSGGNGDGDGNDGDAGGSVGGGGAPLGVPALGGPGGGSTQGSPSSITPPFPFASLVLAFLFVVPMNFVIQSYGSTIMEERIDRRGELLLVSPVSPAEIVAGKTLPYPLALLSVSVAVAALVGGGPLSVAAVLPVALVFLAATFVGAMFARSFKELTFVTVAVSVSLTAYVFVPAIFTEISPIALISPLTVVVRDLQGTGVSAGEFAFSTGPFLLTALVLFALGAGVYREEDMFTQRPVHLKALDALAARVRSARGVALWSALFVPFVFVAELLVVALLFAVSASVSEALVLPLLVAAVATVEEVAKSAHVLAGFEAARFRRGLRTAVVVGVASGLGFFLGEKLTVVVQLVGLPDLAVGRAVAPEAASATPLVTLGLLLAPLALHTVTATIAAVGASRSRTAYLATLPVAVLVHWTYNLAVLGVVGGG